MSAAMELATRIAQKKAKLADLNENQSRSKSIATRQAFGTQIGVLAGEVAADEVRLKEIEKGEEAKVEAAETEAENALGVEQYYGMIDQLDRSVKETLTPAKIRAGAHAVSKGATPQSVMANIFRSAEIKGQNRQIAWEAARERAKMTGQMPLHLMLPEEREAFMQQRFEKRAAYYERRGLEKAKATAEAHADNEVEDKLDKMLWGKDEEGNKVRIRANWEGFDDTEKQRVNALYLRNELSDEAEQEVASAIEWSSTDKPWFLTPTVPQGATASPEAPAAPAKSYPSWLVETPEARAKWDAASDETKAEQIRKRGQ